jgi:hypothetical protein
MQFEIIDDFIGVLAIKLNECHRPGLFFLLVQKCIEATDRIIANRLYGSCPIKNDSNVRVVVFHCIPPTVSCRFRRGNLTCIIRAS